MQEKEWHTQPSESSKVTATVTKRRQEDGKDTVHLLDEHKAIDRDFNQPNDKWLAPEPMAAYLDKHFNRSPV